MKTLLWCLAFLLALIVEVSILPQFFGSSAPSLGQAVFILGVAFLGFRTGFAFAAFAGVLLDSVAGGGTHTLVALATFFTMRTFGALSQWEEPLGRIGQVVAGLVAIPALRLLAAPVLAAALGVAVAPLHAADAASAAFLREVAFALAWFMCFSWFEIRRARTHRVRRLAHL